jgi:hypothetical protein
MKFSMKFGKGLAINCSVIEICDLSRERTLGAQCEVKGIGLGSALVTTKSKVKI